MHYYCRKRIAGGGSGGPRMVEDGCAGGGPAGRMRWWSPGLAGGGVIAAGAEALLAQVAERLGAPVFTTLMGKCALSSEHPLKRGLPWHRATSDLTNMGSLF